MPGPTAVNYGKPDPPPDLPGFYHPQHGWEWHSMRTRNTYQWVTERWVDVSDAEVFGDFCYSHNRREPLPPHESHTPVFKICGECHHVWLDKDEFISDVRYLYDRLRLKFSKIREEDYLACPLCEIAF